MVGIFDLVVLVLPNVLPDPQEYRDPSDFSAKLDLNPAAIAVQSVSIPVLSGEVESTLE